MSAHREVLATEDRFFTALSRKDQDGLERVVAEDFMLIDVLTGSEVPRDLFVGLIGSQQLEFDAIERLDTRVRLYDSAAIVTGRTRLIGRFEGRAFQVHSRYTHVYTRAAEGWRLVAAQGTPVVEEEPG